MTSVIPLKHLARINERALPATTDPEREIRYIDIGSVENGRLTQPPQQMRFGDAPSRARRLVRDGDTIISTVRTYLRAVWPVTGDTDDLVVSTGFAVLTPTDVNPRYFSWWVQSDTFIEEVVARSVGVSYPAINPTELGNLAVRVPPPTEQRAIADYLDTQTNRIDTLVTKKRRMIELIEERWDTWLRNVLRSTICPMLPLKRKWRVIDCKHRTPTYVDHGYPVMSPGDVTPGRLDLTRAHRFVDETDFKDLAGGSRRPSKGDILYSRNASIGIASYVDTDTAFTMGQDVCLVTSDDMDQIYLMYVLNSIGVDQLEAQKIGSTFSRVNIAQILELEIPVPGLETQRNLSSKFDRSALQMSRTCGLLNQQLDLLTERRQALITAAVTGDLPVLGGRGGTTRSPRSLSQRP